MEAWLHRQLFPMKKSFWWNCLHSCGQWYKEIPCYEKFPIVSLRALRIAQSFDGSACLKKKGY